MSATPSSSSHLASPTSLSLEKVGAVTVSLDKSEAIIVSSDIVAGTSSSDESDPYDFPDGGREAWLVVLGAWLTSFSSFGYINAFGVYQNYYQIHQLAHYTPSDISWIGSIQLSMLFFGGLVCGRLFDRGYLRHIMAGGTLVAVFGLMMTSLARTYWEIVLAQGIVFGIGIGMVYIPALSCISHFFRKRRSTAYGIVESGSSCGGIIFPILLNKMSSHPSIGFAWAVRTSGFVILAFLTAATFLLQTRLPPSKTRGPLIDFRVFKDITYSIFLLGAFIVLLGLYFPVFYLQEYAILHGIDHNLAFYLLSMLNAGSAFGRLIPNFLADTWGVLNVLCIACTCSGILAYTFFALKTQAGFIVFAIIFGFFNGTYVSTISPCIASLTADLTGIGLRIGMLFGTQSIAALIGSPIAGAIVTRQHDRFVGASAFAGSAVLLGTAITAIARTLHARAKGTSRV